MKNCSICNNELMSRKKRMYCSPNCQRKKAAIKNQNYRDRAKALKPKAFCLACQKPVPDGQRKFCTELCQRKYGMRRANRKTYILNKKRGIERRLKLVKMLGDSCNVCGYNTNYSCLVFHHKDQSIKKFELNARSCSQFDWGLLLEESIKCTLLCHNCHGEIHNPQCSKENVG